jgi:iron complex outermembrane receptor protein
VSVLALGIAAPAFGQEAPAAEPSGPAPQADVAGDVVIVTARKREEDLQDVPLAITAVSAEVLEDANIQNLSDVAAMTAGIILPKSSTETDRAVIRGVNSLSEGAAADPTVAVFLDGVYLANPSAASLGMIDMERIEVVKGPVSALYGRAGYSGAINYVTRQPSDNLAAKATVTGGTGGLFQAIGSVSGPVIEDILSVGAAVNYSTFDGTYEDKATGIKAGGHEKKDARVSFNLTPTADFYVRGGYYYGDDWFAQSPNSTLDNNCGLPVADPVIAQQTLGSYCGEVSVGRPPEFANIPGSAGQSGNEREVQVGNVTAGYDFGFASLDSTLGYVRVIQQTFEDFTYKRNGIPFRLTPGGGIVNLYELFGADANNEDVSLEIKLTSAAEQRFRWMGGVYGAKNQGATSTIIGLDASKIPAGQTITGSGALFLTPDGSPSQTNKTLVDTTDEQWAIFASADYDILENLTFTAEGRYVHQEKEQDILSNTFVTSTFRPYGPPTATSFNFTTWRSNLTWKITPTVMTYASAATGAKAGGFNSRATIASEIAYDPEFNTTYEVGVKSDFFGGALRTNLALFKIDADGLQVSGPSDDPQNVGYVTKNFGSFTNIGGELEAIYEATDFLTLNAGIAYVDATLNDDAYDYSFSIPLCRTIPQYCAASRITDIQTPQGVRQAVSLDGYKVPGTSDLMANFGAEFYGAVAGWDWKARLDGRYESERWQTPVNYYYVPERTVLDFHASVSKDNIRIGAFVENITDDDTPNRANMQVRLNDFGAHPILRLPDGRQAGVSLTLEY